MEEKAINEQLKRYYEMLYPSQLKENEYVCLFMVKTDKEGNTACNEDGSEIKFHKYVKIMSSMRNILESISTITISILH